MALLAVGIADFALERLRDAADRGRHLLHRSDLRDLLADGLNDLRARGELASRRVTPDTGNHLEVMACRAAQRAAAADASGPAHA
ncbi:hypothetical protein A6A06_39425 [Streptomyces sp. CB02923]|nr:hypothetical protein A6A06_39425 [Streptomyces sp. CB02923]